jgi:cation:H+ antiporter
VPFNPGLEAAIFAVLALVSLRASASLVVRLERIGERIGMTEALVGLVVALCADAPEITSSAAALVRGQKDVGAGVVLGSNVFNLAALLGLGAVVAGRIALHRRVVIFDGVVALWMAAVTLVTLVGRIGPKVGLVLVLVVFVPYVAASAAGGRRLARLPLLPRRSRNFLVRAVREEEAELAFATRPDPGGLHDMGIAAIAVVVVVVASVAMENTGSALGTRYGIPDIVIGGVVLAAVTSMPNAVAAIHLASGGRGAATLAATLNSNTLNVVAGLFVPAAVTGLGAASSGAVLAAAWFAALTAVTLLLAYRGRGLRRIEGALVITGYIAFVIVLVAR